MRYFLFLRNECQLFEFSFIRTSSKISSFDSFKFYLIEDVCLRRGENDQKIWTTGCPGATLEINGGEHSSGNYPKNDLNRDPTTFWHSGEDYDILK